MADYNVLDLALNLAIVCLAVFFAIRNKRSPLLVLGFACLFLAGLVRLLSRFRFAEQYREIASPAGRWLFVAFIILGIGGGILAQRRQANSTEES